MLDGLTSRWITLWRCAAPSAASRSSPRRTTSRRREGPALEVRGQCLAGDVVHGEVQETIGFAAPMHPDHVGVTQPGCMAGLAEEPLGRDGRGQLGLEDLDGDGTVEPRVPAEEDDAHTAASDLALDGDPRSQRRTQTFEHRCHRSRRLGPADI